MGIKRLDWDSDFFGFEVGEIFDKTIIEDLDKYKLLIVKQKKDEDLQLKKFKKRFQETKVIFQKKLLFDNLIVNVDSIIDFDDLPIPKTIFYPLAFESGRYSRFKLDTNFSKKKFELLYIRWVDNSVNKQFADKVFYAKNNDEIVGFVTVKLNEKYGVIGLIAVLANFQGKGIGKKLISKVEAFCVSNKILELRIPTQKENVLACAFYNNNGYQIFEETIIKHYWRNENYL